MLISYGEILVKPIMLFLNPRSALSHLCMSQRKKAKQIVGIWHKSFKSAQKEQHVAFLYLANDILQNSRRKGSEFVSEFWKVMPSALKHVNEHGDANGKKAASRLVISFNSLIFFLACRFSCIDEL